MRDVARIVLTGGPCSGKTTILPIVRKALEDDGVAVGVVPEVATILFANGWNPRACTNTAARFMHQREICRLQMAFEKTIYASLQTNSSVRSAMICDRGTRDNLAYMGAEERLLVEDFMGRQLDGDRYDGVIHLVSVAADMPELYKQDSIRTESLYEAQRLEKLTMEAWDNCGITRRYINYNKLGWDHKAASVVRDAKSIVRAVCNG